MPPPSELGGRGWFAVGASVIGSAHTRHQRPNQDAFAYRHGEHGVVAVVADGHGAAQHPRSAIGARFAAELLAERLAALPGDEPDDPAALRSTAETFFRDWRERVAADASARPLELSERAAMDGEDGTTGFVHRAYGTTVVAVGAGATRICALAVGDGDLGWVDGDGSDHALCATSPKIGVETASLAAGEPGRALRVEVVPAGDVHAVWACTDGFSDAQQDPQWRALVAEQLRTLDGGGAGLESDLQGWLAPAAQTGGDDTTMVLLLRRQ